jgi:hypothetical protein
MNHHIYNRLRTMMKAIVLFLSILSFAVAYIPHGRILTRVTQLASSKITITEGVDFDTIAREWRLKVIDIFK